MTSAKDKAFYALWGLTTVLVLSVIHIVFWKAPVEATMGIVQKIFYFHVPSAYSMYVSAGVCFVGSVLYFIKPTDARDAFARSGAELAVVFGACMLTTGPLWGAKAWGHYWTWDPRLTTAMLNVMIYVAYNVLRQFTGDGPAERRFAAALGILGAANIPVIHYSVQMWGGNHPQVVTGKGGGLKDPSMQIAFALGMVTFTILTFVLIWARMRVLMAKERLARAEEDAIDLGLDDRAEV